LPALSTSGFQNRSSPDLFWLPEDSLVDSVMSLLNELERDFLSDANVDAIVLLPSVF
jgi:hypothetical protein